MLFLTLKKETSMVLHMGGVPLARIIMPEKNPNQVSLGFKASSIISIDREVVYNKKHPNVDIDASILKQRLVMLEAAA